MWTGVDVTLERGARGRSIAVIAVVLALAAGGITYATIPDSGGATHASYSQAQGTTHLLQGNLFEASFPSEVTLPTSSQTSGNEVTDGVPAPIPTD
jgi:hypothetical protein